MAKSSKVPHMRLKYPRPLLSCPGMSGSFRVVRSSEEVRQIARESAERLLKAFGTPKS